MTWRSVLKSLLQAVIAALVKLGLDFLNRDDKKGGGGEAPPPRDGA